MKCLMLHLCILFSLSLMVNTVGVIAAPPGVKVKNIKVSDGKNWEVADKGLAIGEPVYTDRDYVYTEFPKEYTGLTYIKPANDSKSTADLEVTFEVDKPVWVYIFYWNSKLPKKWLSEKWELVKGEEKTVRASWPSQDEWADVWKSKEPFKDKVAIFEMNDGIGVYPGIVLETADMSVRLGNRLPVVWGRVKEMSFQTFRESSKFEKR